MSAACSEHPQVRILSGIPKKFDSFDTRVSETIELFLLPKILAEQGGSDFSILGLVSLWVCVEVFMPVFALVFCQNSNHAKTLPPRKVSA